MKDGIVVEVKRACKTFEVNRNATIRQRIFSVLGYHDPKEKVEVLKDINFEVKEGEVFGIIGKNGSGKSTLLKTIKGSIKLDSGTIETRGKLIRLAMGMGLDLNQSARQNIYMNASLLGLSFKEIGTIFHDVLKFAGVERFVDTEIKYYSSGMRSRLSFSIAVHANADLFLMDEFFGGVGDINFKKKSFELFKHTFINKKTILYISHNLKNMERFCHRVMLMHQGKMLAIGEPAKVIEEYRNLMKTLN